MDKIRIEQTSIVDLKVDAIVNATNETLRPVSELSKEIFAAAGVERMVSACAEIGQCLTSYAVITPGFDLRCAYVIHAVGPVWRGGKRAEKRRLYRTYQRVLYLAAEHGLRSVALPLISSEVRKFPMGDAWEQAILACRDFLASHPDMRVVFAVPTKDGLSLGMQARRRLLEEGKRSVGLEEFAADTICRLRQEPFARLKSTLVGDYLSFFVTHPASLTRESLAEGVCHYFETLEARRGWDFESRVNAYLSDLDSVVGPRIARPQAAGRGRPEPPQTRAQRYYEKSRGIREGGVTTTEMLIDYSRIMFCLYAEIIRHDHKAIDNFDYSLDGLDPEELIRSLEHEEAEPLPFGAIPLPFGAPAKKPRRLDTTEQYGPGTCTMLITHIILQTILSNRVDKEAGHD